jgi:hypothetical protein
MFTIFFQQEKWPQEHCFLQAKRLSTAHLGEQASDKQNLHKVV